MSNYEMLVLTTTPAGLTSAMDQARSDWNARMSSDGADVCAEVREVTLDLQSYLPRWSLCSSGCADALSADQVEAQASANYELLRGAGRIAEADAIAAEARAIESSNLLKLARANDAGVVNCLWGNDYASGVKDSMRRGGIVVTTNPQLVNLARKEAPEEWTPVRDGLKARYSDAEELAKVMTLEVVMKNAMLLRPIYKVTDGAMGYVSFQLNPKNSADADAMIADAEEIFGWVRDRFDDGDPNVVFKVPGTYAGVRVTEALTAQGIGVNVTVNYAVPQQLAFGEAIEKGCARFSYLTNMDGRLDDPVAEELGEGKADSPEKASTWAGIAVAKKAHTLLHSRLGYKKSILLDASGRGPWHILRSLPGPDQHPIHKTVFPNKQEEFDSVEVEIKPSLSDEIPAEALSKLYKSVLFRQAYEVNGMAPLEFDDFPPAVDTLTTFSAQYDEFVAWCAE